MEAPQAPPVIATIPAELGPVDVLVRHDATGVHVDVRQANSRDSWTPLHLMGGSVVVRDR